MLLGFSLCTTVFTAHLRIKRYPQPWKRLSATKRQRFVCRHVRTRLCRYRVQSMPHTLSTPVAPVVRCVVSAQTGALEADRDRALQQLHRAQAELGAAQRAQSAALAVQRQQAKGRERAGVLERDLAAMVDKQVLSGCMFAEWAAFLTFRALFAHEYRS